MARFDFQKGDLVQNLFLMNTKKREIHALKIIQLMLFWFYSCQLIQLKH